MSRYVFAARRAAIRVLDWTGQHPHKAAIAVLVFVQLAAAVQAALGG